jgi:hypothetical protein
MMRIKKNNRLRKKYQEGGETNALDTISQLGYATGEPLGMGIGFGAQALDFILDMSKNPSDYVPQKMNSQGAYAHGGYIDSPIGDHAFEVEGNPGVDTNARNVKGQDVLLSRGEIVRDEPEGAYVFSNSKSKMPHPLTGETFAETVKPIEKGIAKARKAVNKDYTDTISKNTLGHLEQLIEQNKTREEEVRQQDNNGDAMRYAVGGDIKGLIYALDEARNIRGMSDISPLSHQLTLKKRVKDYVNWNLNPNLYDNLNMRKEVLPTYEVSAKAATSKKLPMYSNVVSTTKTTPQVAGPQYEGVSTLIDNLTNFNFPTTKSPYEYPDKVATSTNKDITKNKDGAPLNKDGTQTGTDDMSYLTPEDKLFMALKSGETLARVLEAGKPATYYRSDPYEVDRIKYNPQDVLDKNQGTYRALLETNTGNANLDRVLQSSFAANKMSQDREGLRQYANMQGQSDLQVNQYNSQVRQQIDNINEQIAARKYAAKDAAYSSIGNLASIFQQAGTARAGNKITLSTLQSLSRRYGIDIEELKATMGWGGKDSENGLVKYKE